MSKTNGRVKSKELQTIPVEELVNECIEGIQEKKGHDIVSLDLRNISGAVCDFFIVCHGDSPRQVDAIADSVEDHILKTMHEKPWHTEGYTNAEWILLDYVNVVVHVFLKETREFYQLEELWADAEVMELADNY